MCKVSLLATSTRGFSRNLLEGISTRIQAGYHGGCQCFILDQSSSLAKGKLCTIMEQRAALKRYWIRIIGIAHQRDSYQYLPQF